MKRRWAVLSLLLAAGPALGQNQPSAPEQGGSDDPYHLGPAINDVAGGSTEKVGELWSKVPSIAPPLGVIMDMKASAERKAAAVRALSGLVDQDPLLKQVVSKTLGDWDVAREGAPADTPDHPSAQRLADRESATSLAVQLSPRDPDLRARSALAHYRSGHAQEAFADAGTAIALGDKDYINVTIYGRAAYELGDYGLASQAAQAALSINPGSRAAAILYGMSKDRSSNVHLPSVLADVGLTSDAGSAPQAVPADFGIPAPGAAGSQAVLATGRPGGSAQAAAGAAAGPESAASRQSQAFSTDAERKLAVRDFSSAMSLAGQAIALDARNASAWAYRAIAENRLRLYPDAARDASAALDLAPNNSVALQTRAWAFAKQGDYQRALADANASLERDPSGVAFYNRAFALAGLGQTDAAMEALRQAAQADPRIEGKLQQALQLPNKSDIMLVFDDDGPAGRPAAPGAAASRLPRFWRLVLLSASGGLLFALGFLNIFSESWRRKVQATVRRALGSSRSPAAPAGEPAEVGEGFWGQYAQARPIGSGGMGVVYEAVDRRLERKVAIKRMREEIRADPAERARFVAEAKTVAALHHPGIVDIYSIVEESSEVYLVFEFVSGRTVADAVKQGGPMRFDAARRALRQAAEAVDYAHRRGVIHRDLKPSNMMLTDEGALKVMDFGVARQAQEALTRATRTNTVAGTPAYMAPEQEQGAVRPESDVFGLAVCFYEMLTGRLPFDGVGAGMLLSKLNGQHVPPSKAARGLPAGLDLVLSKALVPDPERRYRTAGELSAAVEALAAARQA